MTGLALAWLLAVGASQAQDTDAAVAADPPAPPALTEAEALAPLEAAFEKEYAYLTAERDALSRQIADQAAEASRRRAEAEADLRGLEARLTALQVQVEASETLLDDVERSATSALEAEDALDAAWFQVRTTLQASRDTSLEEPDTEGLQGYADRFALGYREGLADIAAAAAIRTLEGAWFGADGAEVQGQVVEVGRIATFGVGPDGATALVPGGQGRMQAWREGGGATGRILVDGGTAPTMGLYLHEGRTTRIDERPPKTLADVIEAGGVVGWVILVLGAIAGVLMLLRAGLLWSAARGSELAEAVGGRLEAGALDEARALVAEGSGSVPRVLRRVLGAVASGDREGLEDLASEAILAETPRIERFGAAILVVAAVAPLLGLLGTVTGMIATFDVITTYGTGDPRMLSGGISAALVTTQLGLVVAIPALLGGNLLTGWAESLLSRTEGAALRVLNTLELDGGGS